jgi:hypothetical protein
VLHDVLRRKIMKQLRIDDAICFVALFALVFSHFSQGSVALVVPCEIAIAVMVYPLIITRRFFRGFPADAILCTSTMWLIVSLVHLDIMIIIFYVTTPVSVVRVGDAEVYTPSYSILSNLCALECVIFDAFVFDALIRRIARRRRRKLQF